MRTGVAHSLIHGLTAWRRGEGGKEREEEEGVEGRPQILHNLSYRLLKKAISALVAGQWVFLKVPLEKFHHEGANVVAKYRS